VLAAAAEEARGLHAEVAQLLLAPVDHGEGERLLEAVLLRLGRLLLLGRHLLLEVRLVVQVLGDLGEGALAWGWKVENPHLWASLRRAPEAMVSLQDAQAALWGG
jgi:hypothetical protein